MGKMIIKDYCFMTWQPYESRGIAAIDAQLVDKLMQYLDHKESQLAVHVVGAIHLFYELPSIVKPEVTSLGLNEAVEEFGKKVHRVEQMQQQVLSINDWKISAKEIQEALWNYVEVLEGCTIELFQQLDQISFEHWDVGLSRAMALIKDNLTHRMDDLMWAIRRLDQKLFEYRKICEKRSGKQAFWSKLNVFSRRILDRSLESVVHKCQKFLGFRYQKFNERYAGYIQLYKNAESSLQKFYYYRTLATMDLDAQDRFKKVYLFLKLWELNASAKALPQNEIVRALRSTISPDGAMLLFRDYYSTIKNALFDKSRMIKKKFNEVFQDEQARQALIDHAVGYRTELHMLDAMCSKYRDFLLRTDPDPYVRSRWGFSEWIVGPEPKQVKHLQTLMFDIEHLDSLCAGFQSSLKNKMALEYHLTPEEVNKEISNHLREMGQPLASKSMMKRHAESIMISLKLLDELASFDPDVVDYTCTIFCKAMRADWKYHVLQEIPLFHQLYEIHQGIVAPLEDRQHVNRLHKFRGILEHLTQWIRHSETLKHAHEIDLDINDIKAYLQDFFAYVQNVLRKDEQMDKEALGHAINMINQCLLQYRYVFGKFFHELRSDVPEERLLRKQFLFVDQYFEAIENRIG